MTSSPLCYTLKTLPLACTVALAGSTVAEGATAGDADRNNLVVSRNDTTNAIVVVSPDATRGEDFESSRHPQSDTACERFAAEDLVRCIGLMTGSEPELADSDDAIQAAMQEKDRAVLIVGRQALDTAPSLQRSLDEAAKKDPLLRADAIVVRRDKNRVYMAGLTDDGHYHAVAELLHRWGCRWYLPTSFGECIPQRDSLEVGKLDYSYAAPLEMRSYWISWLGSYEGYMPFKLRNRMTIGVPPISAGHALGPLTEEIVPEGKTIFQVPLAKESTARHVAGKIVRKLEENDTKTASLSVSDGVYESDFGRDVELQAGLEDKYFLVPAMSDVFMTLYNRVCELIKEQRPQLYKDIRLGFLAYSNMTIPPQRVIDAADPLYCELAPIDIDPNHGMDEPWSPARQEYRETMKRWAEIMKGRVLIYDYDQSMLVWRDIPNPSHQAFVQDVKHYADAGIIGVQTESRNAIATTFLNLHLRGQLMWNPDLDVQAHLDEFYPAFYGPAADAMSRYWSRIFDAWDDTIITAHEFFVAPGIYTPDLCRKLESDLKRAERAVAPLRRKNNPSRLEKQHVERVEFTRLSFEVLDNYTAMLVAGAGECDYGKAARFGKTALAKRKELAEMNSTFATRVAGRHPMEQDPEKASPAWFPGEVGLYMELADLTEGQTGTLVKKLPAEWAFRRDPHDTGLARGWGYKKDIDLSYWKEHRDEITVRTRKDYPTTEWEMLRTDLYMQAQGVLHPDRQPFTGHAWYRTEVNLSTNDIDSPVHVRFPGVFGDTWLYCNGRLVAHRDQKPLWWRNSYAFTWDVDLSNHLSAGTNILVVRNYIAHEPGGMFRRPFLYGPKQTDE